MGDTLSNCRTNSAADSDEIPLDEAARWVEAALDFSFVEELVQELPVVGGICKAIKTVWSKYQNHQEMQEWLRRLMEDVQIAGNQVRNLNPGDARDGLEGALSEAQQQISKVGVSAMLSPEAAQQRIIAIKDHLHHRVTLSQGQQLQDHSEATLAQGQHIQGELRDLSSMVASLSAPPEREAAFRNLWEALQNLKEFLRHGIVMAIQAGGHFDASLRDGPCQSIYEAHRAFETERPHLSPETSEVTSSLLQTLEADLNNFMDQLRARNLEEVQVKLNTMRGNFFRGMDAVSESHVQALRD